MKLYLDLCVYNRPFDYQGQERIALESSIFVYLLERVERGIHSVVISDVLVYENNRNPDEERRSRVASYFDLGNELVHVDDSVIERARFMTELGYSSVDALHIATAEMAKVDYFITCDDDIVKIEQKGYRCRTARNC